ncbi:unnamed protein product [Ixodes persulcatus]
MASNDPSDQLFSKLSPESGKGVSPDAGNYILVDVCANLVNKKYSRDLDAVVQRAKDAGVKKMLVVGTSAHSTKEALRLTRMFPGTLYCTAGIHPHDAKSWDDDTLQLLREVASNPECVGIGECGLDFNKNFSPPEVQLEVLHRQVALACELKKPLVLHERDAFAPMLAVLEKYADRLPPTVVHCFTGTSEQALKYVAMGFYIGVTGYLWKDKGPLKEALRGVPTERLLLETDSPFLCPNPRAARLGESLKSVPSPRALGLVERYCSFQRNEPCSLPATLELCAALLGLEPHDLALRTTYNALSLFGLD